jgi:hypothetical protein
VPRSVPSWFLNATPTAAKLRAASSEPVAASSIVVESLRSPFSNDSPDTPDCSAAGFHTDRVSTLTPTRCDISSSASPCRCRFDHRSQARHGDSHAEVGQHAVDALGRIGEATQSPA